MTTGTFSLGSSPGLIIHGGAWAIPLDETDAHLAGMNRALAVGRGLIAEGKEADEVVCEVIAVLEGDGAFDAGCGAVLTREGTVELDAGIMRGEDLAFGAVAGVHRIQYPIRVARQVMLEGKGMFRMLIGEGAEAFAEMQQQALVDPASLIHEREAVRHKRLTEKAGYHTSHPFLPGGTVGCVVRDKQGRLAAGTSTGGTPFRPSGRVGDSPLPGCGFYATQDSAASATGWGGAIAQSALCARVTINTGGRNPETRIRSVLTEMQAAIQNTSGEGATGGLIVLDTSGEGAWGYTTPRMARAGWAEGNEQWAMLDASTEK